MRRARGSAAGARVAEGAAALGSGLALFAAAASFERAIDSGPVASAAMEEALKAALILLFGSVAASGSRKARGRGPRSERLRLVAAARGLSLGLAASAAFAAAEGLAYFVALPEAGALARLLWSTPVHLDAALLEALGCLPLLGFRDRREAGAPAAPAPRRGRGMAALAAIARAAARPGAFAAGLAAGACLHAGANLAADRGLGPAGLAIGALVGIGSFAALAKLFLDTAYIGGFLHGAE